MRTFVLTFIFFLSLINIKAQRKQKMKSHENTFLLSGTLKISSIYYGGMNNPNPKPDPSPLKHTTLYVVGLNEMDSTSKIMGKITSDENGKFSIRLPKGTYGIISADDTANLSKNIYFPEDVEIGGQLELTTSQWTSNIGFPILLKDQNKEGIVIVNYRKSYCYTCP